MESYKDKFLQFRQFIQKFEALAFRWRAIEQGKATLFYTLYCMFDNLPGYNKHLDEMEELASTVLGFCQLAKDRRRGLQNETCYNRAANN